ncbi:hypothetical protein [Streptomyces sp. NBC_00439]|uniref:hypothetical protein n=1 Tax=Streptomyces sp. NBC_00439 TaxID=2903650 RepID=UPI002253B20C|nr:hypothetical protein [Streptomyces sp. NBC_00439]MCX5103443.1 hypothetical protein [Streptomyces sp. NBC_00439]
MTSTRDHGYARYKLDGCRCYTCGWAVAQYRDAREHAIRRGEWQPYVDAAPVREHLERLRACSLGLRRVAEIVHVDRKRLQVILNGRPERGTELQEQVRPALAAAVLRVEPTLDNLGSATPISSVGTHRRLTALVAAGWPQAHLAKRLGMSDGNFSSLLGRSQVIVRTARLVRSVYDELWLSDPREHGVGTQPFSRARNHGASHQWAPPGAWDEDTIDDPAAFPDWTGRCGTPGGCHIHSRIGVPACQPCRIARQKARAAARDTTA